MRRYNKVFQNVNFKPIINKNNRINQTMNLTKMDRGQRINLSKENPGLSKVKIGLSWDVKAGFIPDLDATVVCLTVDEKICGTLNA